MPGAREPHGLGAGGRKRPVTRAEALGGSWADTAALRAGRRERRPRAVERGEKLWPKKFRMRPQGLFCQDAPFAKSAFEKNQFFFIRREWQQ
ncbi:elongin-C isoform X4 [Parus major]|uniref:elongin-C isoform X4 n=1 Tax=Parus major TaxID=9157 RepID=UPI0014445A99|nr:elongin-C isoform X4 [Parus major]